MGISKDSILYCYEVNRSIEDSRNIYDFKDISKNLQKNDKIDIYNTELKKWMNGIFLGISYKSINGKLVEINDVLIDGKLDILHVENEQIAAYLSRTSYFTEIMNMPMYNRFYKSDGTIAFLEFPKIISFPTWCTCAQLINEILLQAQHFMNSKINFNTDDENKAKIIENLPFKITLIDTATNQCAICSSKLLDSTTQIMRKSQCSGCSLPNIKLPIKSIIKYFGNLSICLDWIKMTEYETFPAQNDPDSQKMLEKTINLNNEINLHDCFKMLFKDENINGYKCENCKKEGIAKIEHFIEKTPDILCLQLKRFSSIENYIDKIDTLVNFPIHKLSLSDYILSGIHNNNFSKQSYEYELYAIANHLSCIPTGGHYTAFVQSENAKEVWIICNDSILNCCTEKDIITNDAYLLFYKRKIMASSNVINLIY